MILRSNGTKEPESAEDYLLLEIERLKKENEELKSEIKRLEADRCFQWVLYNKQPDGKYIMSFENGALKIEEVKNND